jgi:hypothetical protein
VCHCSSPQGPEAPKGLHYESSFMICLLGLHYDTQLCAPLARPTPFLTSRVLLPFPHTHVHTPLPPKHMRARDSALSATPTCF